MEDTSPKVNKQSFCCPHCKVFAQQQWFRPTLVETHGNMGISDRGPLEDFLLNKCSNCNKYLIWHGDSILFPLPLDGPDASKDMPADVAEDFNEARAVLALSPRSSAALLRLALQKLCKHLGQPGKNINDDIKALVKDGLPPKIQQALDIVRVVGNNAVHPGHIDLRDNYEIALALFGLLNFIVQEMITRPKEIDAIYKTLPQDALDQITRRDSNV